MTAQTPSEEMLQDQQRSRERFLAMVGDLRPQLHRYCARLLGSALDGEDIVQDTLATAYFKLPVVREPRDLRAWLFRIAHNRAIDEIRRRKVRSGEGDEAPEVAVEAEDPVVKAQAVGEALGTLIDRLPPKERAYILLKDVMGFSLQEIATIVGSSVGAVKAALYRGRTKLEGDDGVARQADPATPKHRRLIEEYARCFNAGAWDDLVRLLAADARLEVLEVYDGLGHGAFTDRYCFNYSKFSFDWQLRLGELDGETLLLVDRYFDDRPELFSAIRLWSRDGEIIRVRDYLHVPTYLLESLGVRPTDPIEPVDHSAGGDSSSD